jgi:hypothetical protein
MAKHRNPDDPQHPHDPNAPPPADDANEVEDAAFAEVTEEPGEEAGVLDVAELEEGPTVEAVAEEEDIIDLGAALASTEAPGHLGPVESPSGTSKETWASLVEAADEGPAPGQGTFDAPEDAQRREHRPTEAADVVDLAHGEEVTALTDADVSAEMADDEAVVDLGQGAGEPSGLDLMPAALEAGGSSVMDESEPLDVFEEPRAQLPEGGGSSIDLADIPLPGGTGSPSEVNLEQTENLPALSGEGPMAGEDQTHLMHSPADDESSINLEEVASETPSSSGRDIAELVESGIDLEKPKRTEPTGDYFEAEGEDSAVDLGAASVADEEMPALESLGTPSDEFEAAALEEAGAAAVGEEEAPSEEQTMEEEAAAQEEMAGTAEETEEPPTEEERPRKRRSGAGAFVGGSLLGTLVGVGVCVGLWLAGVVPNGSGTPPQNPGRQPVGPGAVGPGAVAEAPSLDKIKKGLLAGDITQAMENVNKMGANEDPEFLTARGEALWLSSLQQLAQDNKAPTKDELARLDTVTKAKEDLTKANTADAVYWLGHMAEFLDSPEGARAKFQEGLQKFPAQKQRFQSALDSLDVRTPAKGAAGARLSPGAILESRWVALALLALQPPANPPQGGGPGNPPQPGGAQQPGAGPRPDALKVEPGPGEAQGEEAGPDFWNAVKLAQENKYDEAVKALEKARDVHNKVRITRLRKAQNPLSDPTEQIFLKACEELAAYWQARDKLAKAGYLNVAKRLDTTDVLGALDKLAADNKAIAVVAAKLKEEKYDDADLAKGFDQMVADKKKAEDSIKAAEKKAQDATQVASKAKEEVEKKLADVKATLEDANKAKTAAEKKLTDIQAELKTVGLDDADPVKSVQQVVAAAAAVDSLLGKLKEHKYVPAGAGRDEVTKWADRILADLDNPTTAPTRLAAKNLEVVRLQGDLGERWSPKQMLDVWLPVLSDRSQKELAPLAMKDVNRVLADKPNAAALALKGLAARNLGKYDEARATLKDALKGLADGSDAKWSKTAEGALQDLVDPAAYYVPGISMLVANRRMDEAQAALDEALQVFPKEAYGQQSAGLLALRSVVRLDAARNKAKGNLTDAQVAASRQDAADALAGGEAIEGNYATGRVAEETGDLARAEQAYRAALKAYSEAGGVDGFRKNHPVSDLSGSRYRVALARVLLEEVRGGQRMVPAPAPVGGGEPKTTRSKGIASPVVAAPTRLVSWNSAQGLYCAPLIMMNAAAGGELALAEQDAASRPDDPRLDEAVQLAQQAIDAGDNRGYLLKGEALGKKGQWTAGLRTYVEGLRRLCPEYAEGLAWLVDTHPAFQRPDAAKSPDAEKGEQLYARGLLLYFAGRLSEAEQYFLEALRFGEPDARMNYFLGLARLDQGRRDQAEEDFRAAVKLERLNKPSPATVSRSLERIQGPDRRRLNAIRQQAVGGE